MASHIFEEKILYRTRKHWIHPTLQCIKYIFYIAFPLALWVHFIWYSWILTCAVFFILSMLTIAYDHYLWHNSWLLIGNQKITLSVRNGIFSQYAMNIRYRNIRDCAVSKNSMFQFFFKYWNIFIRSSANEWDFRAYFVPKVWKVYALINALSRYSDEERSAIDSIEKLHNLHQQKEFWK